MTNHAKEKLAQGKVAVGLGSRVVKSAEIALIAKQAGMDWLFIDLEHGPIGIDQAGQLAIAAQSAGVTPIARVTHQNLAVAARLLDAGMLGIVFPHVDTAEEAKAAADACRYSPAGKRSVGGSQASQGFAPLSTKELTRRANELVLVVAMIETPKAVDNADAIAAVPGIDALLIGTNDLTLEMGIPGEYGHKRVEDAYKRTIDACRKHKKWPGMGGIYDTVNAKTYVQMGARLLLGGSDLSFVQSGAKARAEFFAGLVN
jgi:2-keto-3-deoxy-L-rhamnonate aldolase RhmA